MEILKRFLCDWGSSDSNMLLFFMLMSFLLGLLTGWLIWGRKIEALLGIVAEKDDTIKDLTTKLTIKETEIKAAHAEDDELRKRIRQHEEEKGQLRMDLFTAKDEIVVLNDKLSLAMSAAAAVPVVTAAGIAAPAAELAIETEVPEEIQNIENVEIPADIPLEIDETPTMTEAEANIEMAVTEGAEIEVAEVTENEESEENEVIEEVTTEEMVVSAPLAREENSFAAAADRRDDLKIVEGIGPKIEELCHNIGIFSWKQLADAEISVLQEMLNNAGKRFQIHNPATWGKQALMAHEGKMDELKVYQEHLKGGKEPE